jgi:hypothetical protein
MKTIRLILNDTLNLVIPETGVRGLEVQNKGASIFLQIGGAGSYRAAINLAKTRAQGFGTGVTDLTKLVFDNSLFYDIHITSLQKIDEGGGSNGGATPNSPLPVPPAPATSSLN